MSLIAIKDRTTEYAKKFGELERSDASVVYIKSAENIEEFSIELSIGDGWAEKMSGGDARMYEIENGKVNIPAKNSIVIQTIESFIVPSNMYGLIMPKGSLLLQKGVLMGSTKIDPLFNGKLKILLYNTTNKKISLKQGEFIASAIFLRTERPIDLPPRRERCLASKSYKWYQKIYHFWKADPKFFIKMAALVLTSSLFSTLLTSIIQYYCQGNSIVTP